MWDNIIEKGIENLFDKSLLARAIQEKKDFIDISQSYTKTERGQEITVLEKWEVNKDEKGNLCDWICENGMKEDFKNFESLFQMLESIIFPASSSITKKEEIQTINNTQPIG